MDRWKEQGLIDLFGLHHLDALVRIVAAGQDVRPGQLFTGGHAARYAGGRRAGAGSCVALVALDVQKAFVAFGADLQHLVAIFRFRVLGPHQFRFADVAVAVDDGSWSSHDLCLSVPAILAHRRPPGRKLD